MGSKAHHGPAYRTGRALLREWWAEMYHGYSSHINQHHDFALIVLTLPLPGPGLRSSVSIATSWLLAHSDFHGEDARLLGDLSSSEEATDLVGLPQRRDQSFYCYAVGELVRQAQDTSPSLLGYHHKIDVTSP